MTSAKTAAALTKAARTEWWVWLRSAVILVFLGIGTLNSGPAPVTPWVIAGLACGVAGWIPWLLRPADRRWELGGLALLGVGGLLILAWPDAFGLVFLVTAALRAGRGFPARTALVTAGLLAAGFTVVVLLTHDHDNLLLTGLGALALCLVIGFARRQNDELRAAAGQARVMAERTDLAREVHDVLAHSLGALSVQLETADALLDHGRVEQAQASVRQAGRLARDGLAETRRAIGVLRGESAGLEPLLRELAAAYEGPAEVMVEGPARGLDPRQTLLLYRTAQESVTNARKHAPRSALSILLRYAERSATVRVVNTLDGPAGDLAATGGGYGLTGLRERAEEAGGRFEAGPVDGGWAVNVTIPL